MVSYHMPATKKNNPSSSWRRAYQGPVKARRVHASQTKQMLFAFFDSQGLIYMHIAPRGATINAKCTVMVLGKFTKNFTMKRPEML
jgi:hypothetical protein